MGKTASATPGTRWRHKRRAPLTLGGSQAAVATPAPRTASARLCRRPNTVESTPTTLRERCGWGNRVVKQGGRGEKAPWSGPRAYVSPASVTGAHFPDSGRGRVFLGQALCMPPEPQGPCLGA